jgi:hypothetical protein
MTDHLMGDIPWVVGFALSLLQGVKTNPFGDFHRLGWGAQGFLQAAFPSAPLRLA